MPHPCHSPLLRHPPLSFDEQFEGYARQESKWCRGSRVVLSAFFYASDEQGMEVEEGGCGERAVLTKGVGPVFTN